jgi:hypothetical protein
MNARTLERLEEALATSAHTHVLSQPSPPRDRVAKITIVEDRSIPRHRARMTAGNVTKLLVSIQSVLTIAVAHLVDPSHEAALTS